MENWGRRRKEITVETQKPQLGTGHQCITRVWVGKILGMCTTQKVFHQCHKSTPAPKFSQYCDDADLGGK